MQIIKDISNSNKINLGNGQIVLSIGNFDGVHRGHQYLIDQNVQLAKKRGWKSAILTFNPHPLKVLNPSGQFEVLFDKVDCIDQLGGLGVDYIILQEFDNRFSSLTAMEFIAELFKNFSVKAMILGMDFCFGLNRGGNLDTIKNETAKYGFELIVPEVFKFNEEVISTSGVKQKLRAGDMKGAQFYLGRNYYLQGDVVQGDQRGRLLGFPTANITSHLAVHLKKGVYKTRSYLNLKNKIEIFDSVTNVGIHPTFVNGSAQVKIETHIFDFNSNIYGSDMKIEFLKFIREEKKFDSKESLVKQIQEDVQIARRPL